MYIIEDYATAVFFCVVTMICWGSWANTQKLAAATWRFELFYWDYVIGILLTSVCFGLTMGSFGEEGRGFIEDIKQADSTHYSSAILGGVLFNLANILLVAAISIAGMSVAFPVGIGLALVLGVLVNYFNDPVGNKVFIFAGVALIVIAILLNAYAYKRKSDNVGMVSKKGLLLAVVAGVLMGFFYRYVAAAMFSDFANPEPGKLSPYTAVFFFAIGILCSNFVFNTLIMMKPFQGEPVAFSDYFKGKFSDHLTGVFGGVVWCIGMAFSIIASGKAGPAISYGLGQGATVVAALWGILIWKEFKQAPKGTNLILNLMLILYILGLGLIIIAR